MRIAVIHYSALPVLGGVEFIIDAHARLFAEHGHEVVLVCECGGEAGSGISLHRLAARETAATAQARAAELRPLLAAADVVMMHNVGTMPFDLALTEALWDLANELPEVRFIAWVHDVAAANPDYQVPVTSERPWSLLRQAHPRWEYVAVSARRAEEWAAVCGSEASRCPVVPNGVDAGSVLGLTDRIRTLAEDQELWTRDLILLHPTRLLRRKNVELGLAVTAALVESGLRPAYLVTAPPDAQNAASAEYARALEQERRARNLEESALFLTEAPLSEADVRSLYQLADALFFPSRQEGFGLPMLEAALHRIPAFCADIEPLRSLPGALPFALELSPGKIAENIIRHLASWPANPPRRAVLRSFTWAAIYRNNLAPLLTNRNNLPTHETLGR